MEKYFEESFCINFIKSRQAQKSNPKMIILNKCYKNVETVSKKQGKNQFLIFTLLYSGNFFAPIASLVFPSF